MTLWSEQVNTWRRGQVKRKSVIERGNYGFILENMVSFSDIPFLMAAVSLLVVFFLSSLVLSLPEEDKHYPSCPPFHCGKLMVPLQQQDQPWMPVVQSWLFGASSEETFDKRRTLVLNGLHLSFRRLYCHQEQSATDTLHSQQLWIQWKLCSP